MKKTYSDIVIFKERISKLDFIRTFIAMWNTHGGTIRIEGGKEFGSYDFYSLTEIFEQLKNQLFIHNNDDNNRVFPIGNTILIRRRCSFFYSRNSEKETDYFEINVNHLRDDSGLWEDAIGLMFYLNQKEEKEYYFRVKGKNIKANEDDAFYWEKVAIYDAPIHKKYQPTNLRIKENLEQKLLTVETIGDFSKKPYLYKYLDLEATLLSLNNGSVRFVEPTNWDDQYEGRFYSATFVNSKKQIINPIYTPFLYACCFTTKQENEAAWVLYSHNRTGLASRCVQFKLNRKKLFDQIVQSVLKCGNLSSIFFGLVHYENKYEIDNVHKRTKNKKSNPLFHKYFDFFSLKSYLNLLLLKRMAFEHEQELRIFIVPKTSYSKTRKKNDGAFIRDGKRSKKIKPLAIAISIDWLEVIEEIKIDKKCTSYEKDLLLQEIVGLIDNSSKMKNNYEKSKLKKKLQPKDFDPYEDKSLKKAPLRINTN